MKPELTAAEFARANGGEMTAWNILSTLCVLTSAAALIVAIFSDYSIPLYLLAIQQMLLAIFAKLP